MKIAIIILTLIIVGLAYIGAVQAYRYVRNWYLELKSLWTELIDFLRTRQKESRVITIKVHNGPPLSQSAPSLEQDKQTKANEVKVPDDEATLTDADDIPDEQLFISIEMNGEEYSLCENVTADELEQMGKTLSVKTAPIQEEMVAATTICKLRNSPMLKDLIAITGNRVEELLKNVIINDPKINKEGFDYSKYITN